MDTSRLQELKAQFSHLYEDGILIIPDRYDIRNFDDSKHIQGILDSHSASAEYIEDQNFIELLSHIERKYAHTLNLLINEAYIAFPDYFEYPAVCILTEELYVHGPPHSPVDNLIFEKGIVIHNHKFLQYWDTICFDYKAYHSYYTDCFLVNNLKPMAYPSRTREKFLHLEDPVYEILEPDWKNLSASEIWSYFKHVHCVYTNPTFLKCDKIAKKIESGAAHCLSFGQFAQVFPLLKGMKKDIRKKRMFNNTKPTKFCDLIYHANLRRSSSFSRLQTRFSRPYSGKIGVFGKQRIRRHLTDATCPVKYKLLIDLKRQVVFILQLGHHTQECEKYQRKKGYLFMKKQMFLFDNTVLDSRFDIKLLRDYGRYEILTVNNRKLWFKTREDKFIPDDSSDSYDAGFSRLLSLLNSTSGEFMYQGEKMKFELDSRMITELIKYDSIQQGLLIGSEYSLQTLGQQSIIGIDVTFNVCKQRSLNLITVVYRTPDDKIVLGCVGFLNGGESAGNIQSFAKAMVKAVGRTQQEPFKKLQYIVTDDSQGTNNGLTSVFGELKVNYRVVEYTTLGPSENRITDVAIVKCAWHKRNNFIRNLDCVGVQLLTEAMWTRNPIVCQKKIDTVLFYYEQMTKIFEASLKTKALFPYKYFKKVKNKSMMKLHVIELKPKKMLHKMKIMLRYVEELQKDRMSWCLCYRLCLPPGYTTDSLDPLSAEVRESIIKEVYNVAEYDNLNIYQTSDVQNIFNKVVHEASNIQKDQSLDSDMSVFIKKLKQDFETDYAKYTSLLSMGQVGLKMVTTSNNESIHNALQNHYKIKNVPTVTQLFLKLQHYFIIKSIPTVKSTYALHLAYDFTSYMTLEQLKKFSQELSTFRLRSPAVKNDIDIMKSRDKIITKHLCGCTNRTSYCIPCCHML